MANIVLTIVPPGVPNFSDGTLRLVVSEKSVALIYRSQGIEFRFQRNFADLQAATKTAGGAFFDALVQNEGALTAMGF